LRREGVRRQEEPVTYGGKPAVGDWRSGVRRTITTRVRSGIEFEY